MFGNRFWLAVVIALLPAVVLGVLLTRGSSEFSAVPYLLVLIWLVAVGGALYRVRMVRCPRCGKTFSVEGWWSPSLRGRRCVHCALELDAG
jgi:undecaprenyl pyrophosphate phosphatase UppP